MLRGAANQTVSVATIPFKLALTVESAVAHPLLGQQFGELLELGLIDERTAVVVLLLVERARGEDSAYAPWLQLLPARLVGWRDKETWVLEMMNVQGWLFDRLSVHCCAFSQASSVHVCMQMPSA